MAEVIKGVHQATELEAAGSRLRRVSLASSWLNSHGHKWDGAVTEINMRGNARSCDGYSEAMEILEQAIEELHADIFARALAIAQAQHSEVRNTVRIISDNLEGRDHG
jgi:hypothetical protein